MGAKNPTPGFGKFELRVSSGDLVGTCETCSAELQMEFLGLDPIYPEFKVFCGRCRTDTRMKIRMLTEKLYPIPYRGRKAWDRHRARFR